MSEKTTRTPSTAAPAVSSDSKILHSTTRIVVVLVAIGAAILSFNALTALAEASGIRADFSWIWAVVVDGFILVATFAAFALKDRGKSKYYAYSTLGVFVVISIIGNAWHAAIAKQGYALPIQAAVIVTAIPPLALFLAIHLLIIMVSPTEEQKEELARQKKRRDRLRAIEEKELERLEKAELIRDLKESQALKIAEEASISPAPKRALAPTVEKVPLSTTSNSVTPIITPVPIPAETNYTETAVQPKILLTEPEVEAKLLQMVEAGQILPTGKTVAEWLGKSERTGQNLVKKFKATLQNDFA